MALGIDQYTSVANKMAEAGLSDARLAQGESHELEAQEPLKPPSNLTKFKAALSHIPLLGKLGGLQKARAETDAYPVTLGQHQATNRQLLSGFMRNLRSEFGDSIAIKAMKDMDLSGAKPLTGRTISTAVSSASQFMKSQKAHNNYEITRFLENPSSGVHSPLQKDMIGLFFDKGINLNGQPTWQEVVGEKPTQFITSYVTKKCAEMSNDGKTRLTNGQIAEAGKEAIDLYQELKTVPGMTKPTLESIMERAGRQDTGSRMKNCAKEFAIVDKIEVLLDQKNPNSMLSKTEALMSKKQGVDKLPDAVLKSISNNTTEELRTLTGAMPKKFGCKEDVSSILDALIPKLEKKVTAALEENHKALELLSGDTVLTEPQRTILKEIAQTRRMDTFQIETYEKTAKSMQDGLKETLDGIRKADASIKSSAADGLDKILRAFEDGLHGMKTKGGKKFWESRSLSSGDMTKIVLRQMIDVAIADLSPKDAEQSMETLTSENSGKLSNGLLQSDDLQLASRLLSIQRELIKAVGAKVGMDDQAVNKMLDNLAGE